MALFLAISLAEVTELDDFTLDETEASAIYRERFEKAMKTDLGRAVWRSLLSLQTAVNGIESRGPYERPAIEHILPNAANIFYETLPAHAGSMPEANQKASCLERCIQRIGSHVEEIVKLICLELDIGEKSIAELPTNKYIVCKNAVTFCHFVDFGRIAGYSEFLRSTPINGLIYFSDQLRQTFETPMNDLCNSLSSNCKYFATSLRRANRIEEKLADLASRS